MSVLKPSEIDNLKISGRILKESLLAVRDAVKPGISTFTLDQIAEREIRKSGAKPSFLGYGGHLERPFPSSLCVSINDEVVHGIPSKDRIIKEGDVVGLDLGAEYKGIFTDAAITVIAGSESENKINSKLLKITRESLLLGVKHAKIGNYIGDIGSVIEKYVLSNGFDVVRSLVGHGVGKAAHDEPQIPNFGKKGTGEPIVKNMVLAIEPMVALGGGETKIDSDGWTVKTFDGKNAAHFEHTILITEKGPVIIA